MNRGGDFRLHVMRNPLRQRFVLAAVALGVTACGHTPLTRTVADAFDFSKPIDRVRLEPDYRYLRVTADGQSLLMVLGYVDQGASGDVETWYTRAGQTIRLMNGRLVSTRGFKMDWTRASYSNLPTWSAAEKQHPVRFARNHDEMPGYRFHVADVVTMREITAPLDSHLTGGLKPQDLRWFEETTDKATRGEPSARYALRARDEQPEVVYGEQCLSQRFCIAWQAWPVTH